MQGLRLHPRQLGQALGGPAGRRGQHDPGLLGPGERDDGAYREALAAARAAGEHGDPLGQGETDRRGLLGGELVAGDPVQPVERHRPVHRLEGGEPVGRGGRRAQAQQPRGQRHLRAVERDQVDGGHAVVEPRDGDRVADHAALAHQLLEARLGECRAHAEDLGRLGDQLRLGEVAVAGLAGLREGEAQPGLDPLRAVVADAEPLGDPVGGLEADAPHVRREPVGLLGDDLDGLVPVQPIDPHGQGGRHPHALQEDHDLLDGLLLLPGLLDHGRALGAEPRHAVQAPGVLLEHAEGVGAEVVDDAFGHLGADALDQAGAEVTADALHRGGEQGAVAADLELAAVQRMAPPASLQAQAPARLGAEQGPDHGDQVGRPGARHPGDGVAGLLVGVGDALQHAVQHRGGGTGRKGRSLGWRGQDHGGSSRFRARPWLGRGVGWPVGA